MDDFNDYSSEHDGDIRSMPPVSVRSKPTSESESDTNVQREGCWRLSFTQSKERSFPLHSYNSQDVNHTHKKKEVNALSMKAARTKKMAVQLTRLVNSLAHKHKRRLSEVEQKICRSSDISSSSTATPLRQQKIVPPEVRVREASMSCYVLWSMSFILCLSLFIHSTERN